MNELKFINPFRPGAGHRPPYLAGRTTEIQEFTEIISQDIIMRNLILTGLRGIGKTVLLESFRPIAQKQGWLWAGTDCSESASVSDETMAIRILTDIAMITSNIRVSENIQTELGFAGKKLATPVYMDFNFLLTQYHQVPGLPIDKLKAIMIFAWKFIQKVGVTGVVFAYDEAQTLSDHAEEKQYPLSLLLDLFQYLQKNGARYLLILTGLPTLLVKLIETRTYTERLFRVLTLDQLTDEESRDAILKPLDKASCPVKFNQKTIDTIVKHSGGYPYFIQFMCREIFDVFAQSPVAAKQQIVPIDAILQKLDNDFFAGRWSRATDREKELLTILAQSGLSVFSLQEAMELSEKSQYKPFSKSQISQMFSRLIEQGLIYRDRRGAYLFAVPLLAQYVMRTIEFT